MNNKRKRKMEKKKKRKRPQDLVTGLLRQRVDVRCGGRVGALWRCWHHQGLGRESRKAGRELVVAGLGWRKVSVFKAKREVPG
jgi:hypothetical protein